MKNFPESQQPNHHQSPSQSPKEFFNPQDLFAFLSKEPLNPPPPQSFFSKDGLSQDIIQVTQAEPDLCLEVFYALYHTLRPQIESQSDVSLKDAWTRFIGGSIIKGSLTPPEKLITERRTKDIKRILSEPEGEQQIFHDLDQVVNSILNLMQKINNYPREILYKKEVIASLTLILDFYQSFRDKVKGLIQIILQKERTNVSYISESDALEDFLEHKAIMMSDIFSQHWAYRIPRSMARKLLSKDLLGRNLKNNNINDPSNHRVIGLPEKSDTPLVFFKANGNPPIQPEKEYMLYNIYQHLQIPVPETALLILTDVFETDPSNFYAVQASEAVLGESSSKACQDQDQEAYVLQTIGAMLTNPSDGSFKNFKYSPKYQALISIDNDEVFKSELLDDNSINVKSILYLLPQIDLPIPQSIKDSFSTLDPYLTIFSWLQDLYKKNKNYQVLYAKLTFQKIRCIYQNLLPQSEVPSLSTCLQQKVLVDHELHDSFFPQILVSKGLLSSLIEKLQLIEKILFNNPSASTQILFEEITPILGKYYRKLRVEFSDPEEALEALWGNKKNGIDYSKISSLLENEELYQTELGETLPPETFFKEYRDLLISQESPLDQFIQRQNQRKKKNVLNLQVALKELQFLIQEGLTNSQSLREIVDFCHTLSKITNNLAKEIIFLLSNLPQQPELKWLLTLEKYFLRSDNLPPKNSQAIIGAFMNKRTLILTGSEKWSLFDNQGFLQKNSSLTGRSIVTFFPQKLPEFYLKQYPEFPGYDFASTFFMKLFGITFLPYQELLIIQNSPKSYPVLLTQKVDGNPVFQVWSNPQAFNNLDPFHTTLLIISAVLLNPEDGKEDNFILSPDGKYLIPIDNDHYFLPSTFQKEGSLWNAFTINTALQTKTLLFCLDEMNKPIPPEVRQHIISLDFDSILTMWMTKLIQVEDRYNNLADQEQRNDFLKNGTVLRIPFYEQFIRNMYWKAHKIQKLLRNGDFQKQTPFHLLEAVEPFTARSYKDSSSSGTLETRFKKATSQLYTKTNIDGSRASVLNTRLILDLIHISEKDLQNDATYNKMGPPDALELLNQLIQERSQKEKVEKELLCELDNKKKEDIWTTLFGNPLLETALKDFFAKPKEGLALKGSKLITSKKLKSFFALAPDTTQKIKFLSLPNSPLLDNETIRTLAEGCPNLEYLNVSGCPKLQEIVTAHGEWSLLARVEAQECFALEKFVSYSPMKILRLESNLKMGIFLEKSNLDVFTISTKANEFEFSCKAGESFQIKYQGKAVSADRFVRNIIQGKEEIKEYFLNSKIPRGENSITSARDLTVFIPVLNMKDSMIEGYDLQGLSLLNLINLKELALSVYYFETSHLNYLIQAHWPKLNHIDLSHIDIYDKGLFIIAKGNWPLLEFLNLRNTRITFKGIEGIVNQSQWPRLKHLNFSQNDVNDKATDVLSRGNWPLLETLGVSHTEVPRRKLLKFILNPNCSNLTEITFGSKDKESLPPNLFQRNWAMLEELDLRCAEITQNEIKFIVNKCSWKRLKHLDLGGNDLNDETLEILGKTNWPLLESLGLDYLSVTMEGVLKFVLNVNWPNFRNIKLPMHFDYPQKWMIEAFLPAEFSQKEKLELNKYQTLTYADLKTRIKLSKCLRLKHLNLSNKSISLEEISLLALAESPKLEELHLENIKITSKGIEIIKKQSNWPPLKHLNISHNDICDEGWSFLALKEWPLLGKINLSNTKLSLNGLVSITNQSKWPQTLLELDISNNDISDEGLSILAHTEWQQLAGLFLKNTKITQQGVEIIVNKIQLPNLIMLDISENVIFDEGLKILASGKWPLFNSLVYNNTQVTLKGHISLLENFKWPDLSYLEHSLTESFFNDNKSPWSPPEIILALATVIFEFEGRKIRSTVMALDINWFHSKEIYLPAKNRVTFIMLPREKWNQIESIYELKNSLPFQTLNLPSNLKLLDLSSTTLFASNEFKKLIFPKNCLIEKLSLRNANITIKDIKWLLKQSSFPNLKKLDVADNHIQNEGLEILVSVKWPLLEQLNVKNTGITAQGLLILIKKSKWPNLKKLNISNNQIQNEGLKTILSGKWPLLESLKIAFTEITCQGIEILVTKSAWPNLKQIDISGNKIKDEGLEKFVSAQWPLLEKLKFRSLEITAQGMKNLISKANWPNLNKLDFSSNREICLKSLACGKWPLLEVLKLNYIRIPDEDIKTLLKNSKWPKLKKIAVAENHERFCVENDERIIKGEKRAYVWTKSYKGEWKKEIPRKEKPDLDLCNIF